MSLRHLLAEAVPPQRTVGLRLRPPPWWLVGLYEFILLFPHADRFGPYKLGLLQRLIPIKEKGGTAPQP
jgi:hypothetical protein